MKMDVENDQYWKKKLLRHFNNDTGYKDPFIEEKHVKVKENRNEYLMEDRESFEFDENLQWDDAGHMMWYDDLDELLSQARDSMVKGEATYECLSLSSHDCVTETVIVTETKYDTNTECELSTAEVTAEPDPVLTVPFRDSLLDDVDRDNMELSQLKMQLPLPKLNYNLDPTHVTASDLVKVSVSKCVSLPMVTSFVSASTLLGTEMPVSTYPFVTAATVPTVAIFLLVNCEVSIAVTEIVLWNKMESLVMVIKPVTLSLVALFLAATSMLGTRYYAVYQTSTTAMLLYEPDPLWLDLVALAYTLDHCTAALKLLLDGPKLVLSSIKVTDVAKAHLALLVVNNYNKIFSTYSYNRYHKFNVKSLVSASLAMLLMLYVANVMYGHTLFMSQHMLLTHLFAMAASVGVFLLVYNKLIFTTSGEYLKLLASACFTLQMALYMAIMVSSNVLLLPLFRLDTGTVLKVDRDYLLLHEKTAAKLHAFPSYKSCMFQNYYDLSTALMYAMDTIIAPYNVDWGARNFCFENLVVIASLYLFNEDHADVTVPLPLLDSCLLPSSDIVSEAKSPFVLVEVEPDPCQLLLGFLASVLLTNCLYFVDAPDPLQNYSQPVLYCHTPEEIYKKMVELLLVELQPDARQLRVMYALDLLTLACLAVYGAFASMTHTNALYFVNEIDLDLTQVHHRYPAFMLPTNALYVADCSEISELAQLSSKLTPPPLLHGLDMDQGCEANLGTVGNQNHVDVTPLAQASLHSAHHYRGH